MKIGSNGHALVLMSRVPKPKRQAAGRQYLGPFYELLYIDDAQPKVFHSFCCPHKRLT